MSDRFRQTLLLQWKTAQWGLLPFVVACFGLPLAALNSAAYTAARNPIGEAEGMLHGLERWVILFPLTAALLGVTLGLAAWSWDHRANHVYALSLPLPRSRYVLLKFVAGAALLLIPTIALLAGTLLGRAGIELPEGLHAYPLALALRFLMAALIVYALAFTLAASTMQTAVRVISVFVGLLLFGTLAVDFARDAFALPDLPSPIELLDAALLEWPGPFHVFGGSWMPIDV